MQLVAYLNFEGNAKEAMDFYAQALGGEVTQRFTYGASPMAEQCGPAAADHVMHSQVEAGGAIIMGADGPPPHAAGRASPPSRGRGRASARNAGRRVHRC